MIKTLFKSMKDTESKRKRKVQFEKESEEDNFMAQLKKLTSSASDNSSVSSASSTNSDNWQIGQETLFPFYQKRLERPSKKLRTKKYSADIIVEIEDRNGQKVPIKCLLDTGTTSTIVLRQYVKKGRAKSHKGARTTWNTLGGTFSTNRKALIDFSFPELTKNKTVTWICHVDDKTNPKTANYDMIIGLDLMMHIGIVVDTNEKVIKWEGHQCPLKEYGTLQETNMLEEIYQLHKDAPSIQSSTERHDTMLDADYSAPDLEQYCN